MPSAQIFNLYRVTLAIDTSATADRIDFNDPGATNFKDGTKENAILTEIEVQSTHAIADNQPAETDQGSISELGNAEKIYTLTGKVKNTFGNSNNGQNPLLILMDLWDSEPSQTTTWPEGRFGILDNHNNVNNLTPTRTGTNQRGLKWRSLKTKDILGTNETEFVIVLQSSKGDGT